MLNALIVSNVVLWIAVILLGALLLALVRQIGVLHERITPAGALVAEDQPSVGDPAPRFYLPDWHGNLIDIGGENTAGRNTLLVFVSPGCPICKTILPIVRSIAHAEAKQLQVVLASDGTREEHTDFVEGNRLGAIPYVLSTELGLAYQVPKLPYGVLIDGAGILRAKGLVNTREHLESLFEAMERGVGSVQEYLRREHQRVGEALESQS